MAQRHLDRLSALDASFLHQEGPVAHMHIGALTILSAPPPTLAEVTAHIGSRLTLVPRFRQRLAHTPLDRGRPVWVDDRGFNLEYHVRHAALPAPGSRDQLRTLLARILSTQLDRRRPLWEAWFVEGLDDGGFALIFKTHHAVTDGVAGVELATVLFDARADAPAMPGPPAQWRPAPDPGLLGLLALGMARDARDGLALIAGAFAAVTHPPAAVRRLRAVADGLSEVVQAVLDPAPPTPLNVPIGPHRGFATASLPLANVRAVKDRFGGTVNDVVLTLVSGALRQFMNDPLERLAAVRASMDGAKQSRQVTAAEVLAGVQDYAPPAMLAQASRLIFSTRLFNLLVTNVPGPQLPLFVLGREIREAYPIAFLPRDHALAVAVASYNGMLNIGLLADHDALPEVDEIGAWMSAELDRLVALARSAEPGSL
jgi:diacylglycerol O-acyltransferase